MKSYFKTLPTRIHFIRSANPVTANPFAVFTKEYGQTEKPKVSQVGVVLGGDGATLKVAPQFIKANIPIFGINYGNLGFLQNSPDEKRNLVERIGAAELFSIRVLRVDITFVDGTVRHEFAVNEAFVFNRRRTETIHLRIKVNGRVHCEKLEADGVMVATAIGSSAYSHSCGGNMVTLDKDVMIVTPNNQSHRGNKLEPFIFEPSVIDIDVLDAEYRRAGVTADTKQINKPVRHVRVTLDPDKKLHMLFDPGYDIHERMLRASRPVLAAG